jgi:2-polyprenyl-3-methyl-5-hydroxy-6-metoxy-1,4-benzoquinol methylase
MDNLEINNVISGEETNVEEIMEKIRENIQKKKGAGNFLDKSSDLYTGSSPKESSSENDIRRDFDYINSKLDIQNNSYSISSHRPLVGKFLVKGRKLVHGEVRRYTDPVFQRQSELNYNLVDLLNEAKERVNSCSNEMEQLRNESEQLRNESEQLRNESEQLKKEMEQLKSEIVINVKKEIESFASSINLDLDNKAWLNRILESSIQKRYKNLTKVTGTADSKINYYVFEERFRGSRESILQHQKNFINYFENCTNVLDIGCGRGEFLELAKEKGINARGIDIEEDMINFCESKGLDVELKDALEALEEIDDKSLDGIFVSQVVEHLSPDYLINLLNLCNRKMKYGFYIIVETVNPLSLYSLANFYIDLSHIKPVHPETLKFLLNIVGFREVETKFLSPVSSELKLKKLPDLDDITEKSKLIIEIYNQNIEIINNILYGAQDYAVIGKK